jgi:hypothetical protein
MQLIFGVRPFLGDAANASSLDDLFAKVFITSSQRSMNGQFQFSVVGLAAGKTNLVEASADLSTWTAINTNVTTGTTLTFTDTSSMQLDRLFYRVVQLP